MTTGAQFILFKGRGYWVTICCSGSLTFPPSLLRSLRQAGRLMSDSSVPPHSSDEERLRESYFCGDLWKEPPSYWNEQTVPWQISRIFWNFKHPNNCGPHADANTPFPPPSLLLSDTKIPRLSEAINTRTPEYIDQNHSCLIWILWRGSLGWGRLNYSSLLRSLRTLTGLMRG